MGGRLGLACGGRRGARIHCLHLLFGFLFKRAYGCPALSMERGGWLVRVHMGSGLTADAWTLLSGGDALLLHLGLRGFHLALGPGLVVSVGDVGGGHCFGDRACKGYEGRARARPGGSGKAGKGSFPPGQTSSRSPLVPLAAGACGSSLTLVLAVVERQSPGALLFGPVAVLVLQGVAVHGVGPEGGGEQGCRLVEGALCVSSLASLVLPQALCKILQLQVGTVGGVG